MYSVILAEGNVLLRSALIEPEQYHAVSNFRPCVCVSFNQSRRQRRRVRLSVANLQYIQEIILLLRRLWRDFNPPAVRLVRL